jgi:hypothetical protein
VSDLVSGNRSYVLAMAALAALALIGLAAALLLPPNPEPQPRGATERIVPNAIVADA